MKPPLPKMGVLSPISLPLSSVGAFPSLSPPLPLVLLVQVHQALFSSPGTRSQTVAWERTATGNAFAGIELCSLLSPRACGETGAQGQLLAKQQQQQQTPASLSPGSGQQSCVATKLIPSAHVLQVCRPSLSPPLRILSVLSPLFPPYRTQTEDWEHPGAICRWVPGKNKMSYFKIYSGARKTLAPSLGLKGPLPISPLNFAGTRHKGSPVSDAG